MESALGTTNLLLGIMAAVSVLQALVLAGASIAAWKAYRQTMAGLIDAQKQVEPLIGRITQLTDKVDGIAADVTAVTSRVASATARAEAAAEAMATFVSVTAGGATLSLGRAALQAYGAVRGIRAACRAFIGPEFNGLRQPVKGEHDVP